MRVIGRRRGRDRDGEEARDPSEAAGDPVVGQDNGPEPPVDANSGTAGVADTSLDPKHAAPGEELIRTAEPGDLLSEPKHAARVAADDLAARVIPIPPPSAEPDLEVGAGAGAAAMTVEEPTAVLTAASDPPPPADEAIAGHVAEAVAPAAVEGLIGGGVGAPRSLPRVIAVANQKGGVGKTTTTVNLGAALADLGYRVLVVDLDPQGNATTGLGIDARNFEHSMYDVIMRETPLEDCIEPTSVRNLFAAPATIDLAGVEIELVPAFSRELKVRRAVESIVDEFDFVLIDCPPSLGLITINGLAAASEVMVPIQCEYYALEGLGQLLRNVHLVASNLNDRLEVSAIVLTMYDARTRLAVDVAAEVREHFGDKVCRIVIPRTVRLSEAPSFGQPITVFDPTSRGAVAYRELAKEVSNGAPQRSG